jgi:predicted acylesterase/phospholipase RssA
MVSQRDFDWFSLAGQPQARVEQGAPTLTGPELDAWKDRFARLTRFLRHKRIVLALSGGGMAMACHVSVLRVLELLNVTPDAIYGTSAGAVIGGLYAAGLSVAELERVMLDISDPDDLFGFAARHPAMRLMAGEVVRAFAAPSFEHASIYGSTKLEGYLGNVLETYTGGVPRMSELRVPFACIAFDIGTGRPDPEERERATKSVFSSEDTPDVSLSDAISASMAIPGTLPPKQIDGRFYIDGASIEHLPIATALDDWHTTQAFGRPRTAVLAVDLGYGGRAPREDTLRNPMDLVLYSGSIQSRALTDYNLTYCHRPLRGFSIILLRPRDISIGLCEIEKIPRVMKTAYEKTVRQLSGRGFFDLTQEHIRRARAFRAHGQPADRSHRG